LKEKKTNLLRTIKSCLWLKRSLSDYVASGCRSKPVYSKMLSLLHDGVMTIQMIESESKKPCVRSMDF